VGAPAGPTGCEGSDAQRGDEQDENSARLWRAGAGFGVFDADLSFDGAANYELVQSVGAVSFGRMFDEGWALRASGGAIVGGTLEGEGHSYDVLPGFMANLTGSRQWLRRTRWFFTTTLGITYSRARTRENAGSQETQTIEASDLRVGGMLGATLFDAWSPYAALRAFGGPVAWRQLGRDRTGSDRHHYAIGVGSSLALWRRLELVVDLAFLGERSLSGGFAIAF
jgi:hypothetical protein